MLLSKHPRSAFNNHILAALPGTEYERLSPYLEMVRLPQHKILYGAGDVVRYGYFPLGGMISLVSVTASGRALEVGMIGNEGMAGLPIILESNISPYQVIVQLTCNAMRVKAEVVRATIKQGGSLQSLLLRYAYMLLTQFSQSAACVSFHLVEARMCRWLLISRDRVHSDTLQLTQEFLSYMLGVPRTSVTTVAVKLQKAGLIRYSRGKIQILDSQGLEDASCECYRAVREQISHFLVA
jgi:CRP-like cAMP-binding protein